MLIDERIKNRLWPLSETEYISLEESIISEGCRDALILWNDILVDGHNRYEICKKNNISYNIIQKEFNDIEEVLEWVDENQLSRRNLEDWQRKLLRARISESKKQPYGLNNLKGKNSHLEYNQKQVAKELNVDVKTLYNDTKYLKAYEDVERSVGKEKVVELARTITANDMIKIGTMDPFEQEKIVNKIKEEGKSVSTIIKKEEIKKLKEYIDKGEIILPEGLFQVIMMDVPWPYGTEYDSDTRRVGNPYPEMKLEDIYKLDIPADDNCILFFWTTHKFLEESFKIINNYGFTYKGLIVWNKDMMGMGATLRMQCEFCLLCFRGNVVWPLTDMRDIITEKRREHSRKPEILYSIIDNNLVGRKLDYFSREVRDGWENFGYEKFTKEI